MKKSTSRKVYMNINGMLFTETEARDYYGGRFETAILAKVIVNKNGTVIGEW